MASDTTAADSGTIWALDKSELDGDTTIRVEYDPFFKKAITYRAYPLASNLREVLDQSIDPGSLQLIFECVDGYQPHMPLERVLDGQGYLAYQIMDLPSGTDWPDSVANKMGPFYLVWPQAKGDKRYVNPYGLAKIHIAPTEDALGPAMPESSALMEGYELFSSTCMKCHSINKVGGTMAPEFNHPRNITEYWTKENIWAYTQDPTSFRYNSQMPPMKGKLSRNQFEKIYAYLLGMKGKKLKE